MSDIKKYTCSILYVLFTHNNCSYSVFFSVCIQKSIFCMSDWVRVLVQLWLSMNSTFPEPRLLFNFSGGQSYDSGAVPRQYKRQYREHSMKTAPGFWKKYLPFKRFPIPGECKLEDILLDCKQIGQTIMKEVCEKSLHSTKCMFYELYFSRFTLLNN